MASDNDDAKEQRVVNFFSEDFEDMLCWRLVDAVTPARYLDIGANHPVKNSVTNFFYREGWRGVAVDPLPQFVNLWSRHRPEDVFLTAAVGAAGNPEDAMNFFEYEPSVLSTGDPDRHRQLRSDPDARHLATHTVPLMTAEQVVDAYPEMYRGVGLLSVDVEGGEFDVLQGLNLERVRPEVACVEISGLIRYGGVFDTPSFQLLSAHDYVMKAVSNSSFVFVDSRLERFASSGGLPFGLR